MKTNNAYFDDGNLFPSSQIPDCKTCCDTFYPEDRGDDPPCYMCPVPKAKLNTRNQIYWNLWQRLSSMDRQNGMSFGPISSVAIIKLLELYGENTVEAYETICYIEGKMYPFLVKTQEEESKKRRAEEKAKQSAAAPPTIMH